MAMLKPKCGKCGGAFLVDLANMKQPKVKVKCPHCGTMNWVIAPSIQIPPTQISPPSTPPAGVKAWLVVHDEQAPLQTFPLPAGIQVIGRKSPNGTADIQIETQDNFMSRRHFQIERYQGRDGQTRFALRDAGSKNGTYLNEVAHSRLREGEEALLHDGDCIQAGRTKIIFKTGSDGRRAARDVSNQPFGKTIIA